MDVICTFCDLQSKLFKIYGCVIISIQNALVNPEVHATSAFTLSYPELDGDLLVPMAYAQKPPLNMRILGECLLLLSLPGKALRTPVDIARLAERFNMRSQSRAW